MDTCPFVRLMVGNLAVKIPSVAARPAGSGVHPSTSPCYCKVKLKNFPMQTAVVPLLAPDAAHPDPAGNAAALAATFHLSKADLGQLAPKGIFAGGGGGGGRKRPRVKIEIYTGRRGTTCGVNSGKLLGKVSVPLDLAGTDTKSVVFHNGWVPIRKGAKVGGGCSASSAVEMYLTVRADPDPRFVFEFDGEPECSPQVFQVQGNLRQPVFTCKLSVRSSGDWTNRSRSIHQSDPSCSRSWLGPFGGGGGGGEVYRPGRERKGWSITVHDLSGARVATASMVTPFVPSPADSDRVSKANPGAWLILRPSGPDGTLKSWGRLEAWRERGDAAIGYRFHLLLPDSDAAALLAESALSTSKGGKFCIDLGRCSTPAGPSPAGSPHGSGDYGYNLWPFSAYRGFVMSSTVEGEGKCSRPVVEVGMQHIGCLEDAAAYIALAAAVDLSVDACKLFSHKLRKELCQQLDL